MKNINCNVTSLLNETSSLKDNSTSQHQKIACDVAKRLKTLLEQFVNSKPAMNNPNQKLKNSYLRSLLNMGGSGQSLVGIPVKKLFKAGWFKGTITKYYHVEDFYHINYVDGDGEDHSHADLHKFVDQYQ